MTSLMQHLPLSSVSRIYQGIFWGHRKGTTIYNRGRRRGDEQLRKGDTKTRRQALLFELQCGVFNIIRNVSLKGKCTWFFEPWLGLFLSLTSAIIGREEVWWIAAFFLHPRDGWTRRELGTFWGKRSGMV